MSEFSFHVPERGDPARMAYALECAKSNIYFAARASGYSHADAVAESERCAAGELAAAERDGRFQP